MADKVIVAHKGIPCTPPVVDGVEFIPLGEDGIFVGECSEEQASDFCRNPAFSRYGGALVFPGASVSEGAPAVGTPAAPAPVVKKKK